jgi:hypothetical protein
MFAVNFSLWVKVIAPCAGNLRKCTLQKNKKRKRGTGRYSMKYFKDSTLIIEALALMGIIAVTYWFFRILAILMVKGVF